MSTDVLDRPQTAPVRSERCEAFLSEPYQSIINDIVEVHRLRQGIIKAQTKLALRARAGLRRLVAHVGEWGDKDALDRTKKKVDLLYAQAVGDPAHPHHLMVLPYLMASEPLEQHRKSYEAEMVRLAKRLPVYQWVKSIKGFGDISFATIVGEAGDVGKYRDHSALWKRMGVAVLDGSRQGAPGTGATAEDWIRHGYRGSRRSVLWNAGNGVIGGVGKGIRLLPGEDPWMRGDLTDYQCIYIDRLRKEAMSCPFQKKGKVELDASGAPVTVKIADNGKESFTKYAAARAKRYVEKQLLRDLYKEWRRAKA